MVAYPQHISSQEYLEKERSSQVKHEYVNGRIYAMAGASDTHITIMLNLAVLLRNHLRGSGCRLYVSDMKVQIEQSEIFYYPDLLVTCDPRDTENAYFKVHACLIAEVLSPSTEAADRGRKFRHYRQITSLQEYLLISQSSMNIDLYHSGSGGIWNLHPLGVGDTLNLESVEFSCPIEALYEDVLFADEENLTV